MNGGFPPIHKINIKNIVTNKYASSDERLFTSTTKLDIPQKMPKKHLPTKEREFTSTKYVDINHILNQSSNKIKVNTTPSNKMDYIQIINTF